MALSKKKRKFIKRNAEAMTPEEISKALGIHVREVRSVIGASAAFSKSHSASSAVFMALPWCLAILCLAAPLLFVKNAYDFANLPQALVIQLGALLLASAWCFAVAAKGNVRLGSGLLALPLLVFLLWASVSFLYAHNKWEGGRVLAHWWACGLIYFLVLNSMRTEKDCRRLLWGFIIAATINSLLGISQYLWGIDLIPQSVPPAGTFANKNMAAHFMVLSIPLAGALFITSKRIAWSWFLAAAGVLMLVFLFYTRTKAAWLALAIEITIFGALLLRAKLQKRSLRLPRFKYAAAGTCLLLAAVMMNTGPEGFGRGFSSVVSQIAPAVVDDQGESVRSIPYASKGLRLDIWRNTLEMIKDRPLLGFGLGNHKVFYPVYHSKAVTEQVFSETVQLHNVHNDFLQMFSEMGLPGILAALWTALIFLKIVFRLPTSAPLRIETIALAIAGAGILVNSLFCFPLERAIPPFALAVYMGIAAFAYMGKGKETNLSTRARYAAALACAAFMIAFLWTASLAGRVLTADQHYFKVSSLEKISAWEPLIREAEKAYALDPRRLTTLSYMGRAYVETGKHEKAIEVLRKIVEGYPYHINALLNLGVAMSNLGRMEEALETYRRVLSIKPNYAKAYNNMGNIHMNLDEMEQAVESFRKAAQLDPSDALIHFNLGIAESRSENFERAARAFERAVELNPRWDMARRSLGILYAQYLNQPRQAVMELKKALEINPSMKDADQIRALINIIENP